MTDPRDSSTVSGASPPDPLTSIGGPDGLRKILSAFYHRMANDVWVGFFFHGHDLEEIIGGQHAFLLRALGGRSGPSGSHARDAHNALVAIREGHIERRLQLLRETLVAHDVPTDLATRWLAVEQGIGLAILRQARNGGDGAPRRAD